MTPDIQSVPMLYWLRLPPSLLYLITTRFLFLVQTIKPRLVPGILAIKLKLLPYILD